MKMKGEHPNNFISKDMHPILEIFFLFSQLKNLYRQGYLARGVSELDCETVAEHSYSVAILGYVIVREYRQDLDPHKVLLLGIFHEMGEVFFGDIIPNDNIDSRTKRQEELKSVEKIFSVFPDPKKYIDIWLEYEDQLSSEAIFIKELDKLEMSFQTLLYEKRGYKKLNDLYDSLVDIIKSPELKNVFVSVMKSR